MKIINVLALCVLLNGCSTYGACPKPPPVEPLDMDIWHIDHNASISDTVKSTVISNQQCMTKLDECLSYLEKYN